MKLLKIIGGLMAFGAVMLAIGVGAVFYAFYYYGKDLPDYTQLKDYNPPVMTRVHAGDGQLMAEFAIEKRVFVPINAIPKRVIKTFLAAEDRNFYSHKGIDPKGVMRAVIVNLKNAGKGRRLVGASTITQQVAKNFLLTNEVSYIRKIKEAILALRIEKAFEKERILELYLNEIYLGSGAYGVAAASLRYFNKSLVELSIAETAYLAALPKAPNNYHPIRNREKAIERRNWVIDGLVVTNIITAEEAVQAKAEPLIMSSRSETAFYEAPYFAEEVRRELVDMYGEDKLYKGGLAVHSTVDPKLQDIAKRSLQQGLENYDRRHGWRGPVATIDVLGWQQALIETPFPKGTPDGWGKAVVLSMDNSSVTLGLPDGTQGSLPFGEMRWAREWMEDQKRGPSLKRPSDALNKGEVILVERVTQDDKENPYPVNTFALRQIPDIQGGLVALDPHTGRVLAMVGGYDFAKSQFNRATQAKRQPGSAFKPFVYLAALDHGYTPSTLILDAPFVQDQGPGLPKWRPANYTRKFYGPSTMRLGIEKSRNLMTVRLAQTVGMDTISEYARRFGITENLPEVLSMSLGSGETTLMDMTAAYAMLVNGGKQVTPSIIDRIQNRDGLSVFKHDTRPCPACQLETQWIGDEVVPQIPDMREQVTSEESAYQIVSILEGVVQRGTGRRIASVGKPLGGKTGTTNRSRDTWFVGFSPDLVTGVFVGFDTPKPLGKKETGSSVAAPIFKEFMREALADEAATPFRIPNGINMIRVNARTGQDARPGESGVIWEAFKAGTSPSESNQILEGQSAQIVTPGDVDTGGGLY